MIIVGMVSNQGNRWAVAAGTFVLWGLVAASAVYWGMKLSSAQITGPVAPPAPSAPPGDPAAIAKLLGATPAAPTAAAPAPSLASRFALLGVVAEQDGGGAALISVDGRPPKPFRVGASLDEGLVLQSVQPRTVAIGPSLKAQPALTLELPPRK
jgi:general secretion pathway protein C